MAPKARLSNQGELWIWEGGYRCVMGSGFDPETSWKAWDAGIVQVFSLVHKIES